MPKIFVLIDFYLPGYKAGGPLRTISNMVEKLGDRFEFLILTRDRDVEDTVPYPRVKVNNWNQVGKARVYYASVDSWSLSTISRLIKNESPDVIYLNSFFSRVSLNFLLLRWLKTIANIPVIIAPRGEFSSGALALKAFKKKIHIWLTLKINFYRDLIWHASSAFEERDVRAVIGRDCTVHIAPDIPDQRLLRDGLLIQKPKKTAGKVRFVFLSRISPKKNLRQALEMLRGSSGQITLDIYGPLEDGHYWQECMGIIAAMPNDVQVTYQGLLSHEKVAETLLQYHFFLLPTLGENFGHAILEALAAGCPVLISDQTPWMDLAAKQVGWDLPLSKLDRWRDVLQQCIDMDETVYTNLSQSAREFARDWISSSDVEHDTVALFRRAMESQECVVSPA